ncbi:Protein cereblon [Papilio machaon]|uniref:Protein cereblon n=1 Tax=Papilio machaon TaxID=76193 RepID=A0A194RA26_PAPMA|nr:Protein cereblon [Papilio machaon]
MDDVSSVNVSDGDAESDGEGEEELNEHSSEGESSEDMTQQGAAEEEQHFDKSLAASHSYMGGGLVALRGRSVLEPGWRGQLLVAAHSGAVFPGETVPMLLPDHEDATLLIAVIHQNKLFGLLCPDETGSMVSGYGVVCEVYEAGSAGAGPARGNTALSCKARARHRFRLLDMPKHPVPMHSYTRMRFAEVRILPELQPADPLRFARLASLDSLRTPRPAPASAPALAPGHAPDYAPGDSGPGPRDSSVERRVRDMDAALTPWPRFVYELLDYRRVRDKLINYFSTFDLGRLPEEAVALSFWVASNLTLSARDRLALFAVDDALLRLHMELRFIARKSALCCAACGAEIARREAPPPPPPPPHASDTAALRRRFDALSRSLRPQRFFGLCRNYVQPRADAEPDRL